MLPGLPRSDFLQPNAYLDVRSPAAPDCGISVKTNHPTSMQRRSGCPSNGKRQGVRSASASHSFYVIKRLQRHAAVHTSVADRHFRT